MPAEPESHGLLALCCTVARLQHGYRAMAILYSSTSKTPIAGLDDYLMKLKSPLSARRFNAWSYPLEAAISVRSRQPRGQRVVSTGRRCLAFEGLGGKSRPDRFTCRTSRLRCSSRRATPPGLPHLNKSPPAELPTTSPILPLAGICCNCETERTKRRSVHSCRRAD